jgi:tRNA-guanine family transglycosylase
MQMKFKLKNTNNKARRGTMIFARGMVETPAFMPVGTYGAVTLSAGYGVHSSKIMTISAPKSD